jgi:hypothetical protein
MKYSLALTLTLTLLVGSVGAQDETLSDIDRELLLERLAEIKNSSDSTVKGRLQVALTAFRRGRASDAAAHDLYLDCTEKVRFEDQLRKTSEFRDWKTRHKARTDTESFRLALRHQLNWLALTLEVTAAKDASAFGDRALAVVDSILNDAEKLKGQEKLLRQDPMQSVFAEAYSVKSDKIENWPSTPLDLDTLYDSVVLPPLRDGNSTSSLRKAWMKRIEQEGLLLDKWSSTASSDKDRKPELEKWMKEGRINLLWDMEVDLFRNGDEKGASIRMLKHLKENMSHKSAPRWITQFTTLVKGGSIDGTATDRVDGDNSASTPSE